MQFLVCENVRFQTITMTEETLYIAQWPIFKNNNNNNKIIIITDLYSAFRSEDTEALDAAYKD